MDIQFHCDEQHNFLNGVSVRAFAYENYSIDPHNHDFYEVNIVLAGSGIHCIEQGEFSVSAGDVFVLPPMVTHAYRNTKDLTVYHILIKKDFLWSNREESHSVKGFIQLTEIEPVLRSNASSACFLHLTASQMMDLKRELSWIGEGGKYDGFAHTMMRYHTVWKLLYWFSGLLDAQNQAREDSGKNHYQTAMLTALEYIHQNYSDKITVDNLCNLTYMSRSSFLRHFYNVCGKSPAVYLNEYRCGRAVELLQKGEHSKTEVAHLCGFYDLSHMERMMKKFGTRD